MATIASIKTSIKTLLDATGYFGSVQTEPQESGDTSKPYITMWHMSGRSSALTMSGFVRRLGLTLDLVIAREPMQDDAGVLVRADTAVQQFLAVMEANYTLSDSVMLWTMESDYSTGYSQDDGSVVVKIPTMIEYQP